MTVASEVRYTAWGEIRDAVQNATIITTPSYSLTKYTFTGQFSYMDDPTTGTTEGFGLMFYQSRFYDPSLGRFTQADSIVPPSPQGYDRYAYAFNNPVLYNDPDGHCGILCAVVGAGMILYGGAILYASIKTDNAEPVGDTASNIWEIMKQGENQAEHVNITGEGLQSLQNDPSVKGALKDIIADIRGKPGYGEQAFSIPDGNKILTKTFEASGPGGEWYSGLAEWNQAFLMVNSGTLNATNVKVSADGTILLTLKAEDQFDYLPDFRNDAGRRLFSYMAYNLGAIGSYPAYHEKPFPTTATWNETIPPPATGGCQHCR